MNKDDINQYLCTKVGSHWLGIDIHKVIEIVNPNDEGYHVFDGEGKSGTIKYRGNYIPTIHLGESIKSEDIKYVTSSRILITDIEDNTFGLIVDSAEEILRIPKKGVKSVDEISPEFSSEILDGLIEEEERKIHIISVDKVFNLAHIGR